MYSCFIFIIFYFIFVSGIKYFQELSTVFNESYAGKPGKK